MSTTNLLSTKEVAELLGVSPRMIQKWCKDGKLDCQKIGKNYKIFRSSLEPYEKIIKENGGKINHDGK